MLWFWDFGSADARFTRRRVEGLMNVAAGRANVLKPSEQVDRRDMARWRTMSGKSRCLFSSKFVESWTRGRADSKCHSLPKILSIPTLIGSSGPFGNSSMQEDTLGQKMETKGMQSRSGSTRW